MQSKHFLFHYQLTELQDFPYLQSVRHLGLSSRLIAPVLEVMTSMQPMNMHMIS
jgi:hypothetical protein